MKIKAYIFSLALTASFSGPAFAGPELSDLTTSDYITVGALDWAWAAPITSGVWFGANTLYEASLHAGWREATDNEWMVRPDYTAFGTTCASKYWNSVFTHCDFGDSLSQHWVAGPEDAADLWYVRDVGGSQIPEPGSLALAGLALVATVVTRKKKQKTS